MAKHTNPNPVAEIAETLREDARRKVARKGSPFTDASDLLAATLRQAIAEREQRQAGNPTANRHTLVALQEANLTVAALSEALADEAGLRAGWVAELDRLEAGSVYGDDDPLLEESPAETLLRLLHVRDTWVAWSRSRRGVWADGDGEGQAAG